MRLLVCIMCMLAVLALAGTAAAAAPVHTDKGDKAMIFEFVGLSDLSLNGYDQSWGVGMRYYFSDMNAIRAGIVFGNQKYTLKAQEEGQDDLENKENEYGIDVTYEHHLKAPCASVSPYIGGALGIFTWKNEYPAGGARDYAKETEKENGYFGGACAGFEWGFTDCMTLGAEYRVGLFSENYKDEVSSGGSTYTLSETTTSFTGFSTSMLFLSVYW
jgi:opacity protein-like surface antigen